MNDPCRLPTEPAYAGPPPNQVMRRSIRQLGSDFITLAELQAELLKVDLRDWSKGIVRALAAGAIALVLLLASLPVLLMSVGYFLSESTRLSTGAGMLIAAGGAILVAAICGALAVWSLKREQGILQRFSEELGKNIRWLKEVLSSPSTAHVATSEPTSVR
jgi:uncharacterized membrane protein YqjE